MSKALHYPRPSEAPSVVHFQGKPFDNEELRDYYYAVGKQHGYIRFLGLPIGRDPGKPVEINRLFVEPLLAAKPVGPDEMDEKRPKTPFYTVIEAMRNSQRIVVLGAPGAGKSTLIHWLADVFTSPEGHPLITTFGRLIPIPIVLRDLQIEALRSTTKLSWDAVMSCFLDQPIARALKNLSHDRRNKFFEDGQAIFLLDGLDEVPHSLREPLRSAIWDGMNRWFRCRWVLTSRIVGYDDCPLHQSASIVHDSSSLFNDSGFKAGKPTKVSTEKSLSEKDSLPIATVLYTAPLNDQQLSLFAKLWYQYYEPSLELAERSASDFLKAVQSNKGTRVLARIPNLATLMTLIYRQYARLPDGRAVLYGKITEAYLESIDEARTLKFNEGSTLTRAQKERWLAEIAFDMQSERSGSRSAKTRSSLDGILIPRNALNQSLVEFICQNTQITALEEARVEAARLIDIIAERSGLLFPRGSDDRFGFLHLSFQEYFSALHMRRSILSRGWEVKNDPRVGLDALKVAVKNEVWAESFLLLFELIGEHEGWPEHLIEVLFEEELSWADEKETRGVTFLPLSVVIAISLDCHNGLNLQARKRVWTAAWKCLLSLNCFGKRYHGEPGQVLVRASEFHAEVINVGVDLVLTGQVKDLGLDNGEDNPSLVELLRPSPLHSVRLIGWRMDPRIAEVLANLPYLRHISLEPSVEAAKLLTSLPRLSSLTVECKTVNILVEFWVAVNRLKELRSLDILNGSDLLNLGFLQDNKSIEELTISRCENLKNVAALKKISTLKVIDIDVGPNVSLKPLCSLPNLNTIRLSPGANPSGLAAIAEKTTIYIKTHDGTEKRWKPVSDELL